MSIDKSRGGTHPQWTITPPEKKEISPSVTTQMGLEGTMLSEVKSDREKQTSFHLHVESEGQMAKQNKTDPQMQR